MTGRGIGENYDGDLRAVLIATALRLIETSGTDSLSLRAVARQADVSHAAPAHHFGDKAGLLTVLATAGFDLLGDALRSAVSKDESGTTSITHLDELAQAYIAFAGLNPGHFEIMFRTNLINTKDADYVEASNTTFAEFRSQVSRCQDQAWHSDDDTTEIAVALWSLVHGISVLTANGSLPRVLGGIPETGLASIAKLLLGTSPNP